MPKARAKSKGVPTPPVERRTAPESSTARVAERPSTSAAFYENVVILSSSGLSSDVGAVPMEDIRLEDPQPIISTHTNVKVSKVKSLVSKFESHCLNRKGPSSDVGEISREGPRMEDPQQRTASVSNLKVTKVKSLFSKFESQCLNRKGPSSDVGEISREDPRMEDPQQRTASVSNLKARDAAYEDDIISSSSGPSSDGEDDPTNDDRWMTNHLWWASSDTDSSARDAAYEDYTISSSSVPSSDGEDDPTMVDSSGEFVQMAESIPLFQKVMFDNIAWLKRASPDQKNLPKNYLLRLNASNQIDFTSERSKDICEGIDKIMKKICQNIAERDSRFKGKLVPMGSARNKSKIGDLNEFDYVYQLDTHVLLKEKGTFCRVKIGSENTNILVTFVTDADYELCKSFVTNKIDYEYGRLPQDHISDDSDDENTNNDIKLHTDYIHKIFCDILTYVLNKLKLPPSWCHGGFNRPNFSGIRGNGMAHLLQFDYMGTDEKAPLRLSVDFVIMIGIPGLDFEDYKMETFIKKITGVEDGWVSLSRDQVFNNYSEEEWLAQYSSDAMLKTVMRIGKVFGRLLKFNYKCAIDYQTVVALMTKNNDIIGSALNSARSRYDGEEIYPDEYVTYSDVGEIVQDHSLLKSYVIKRTVMYMMMMSESHGHKWTENDLPDLVICVYMILAKVVDSQFEFSCFEFVENKFRLPLEDISEINEGINHLLCPDRKPLQHSRRAITEGLNQSRYNCILADIEVIDDISRLLQPIHISSLQLSRISAVFQLLRSVCEGQNTEEIVTHREVIPRERRRINYVTKEEYKEMLDNTNTHTNTNTYTNQIRQLLHEDFRHSNV